MRMEIAGAQITDAVVDVIETLQTGPEISKHYLETLDMLTRRVIMDIDAEDTCKDSETLETLRVLQMIRRDLSVLATPPDADYPENDIPTAKF